MKQLIKNILWKLNLVSKTEYVKMQTRFYQEAADKYRLISRLDDVAKHKSANFPVIYPELSILDDNIIGNKTIHLDSMHMRIKVDTYMIKELETNDEYKQSFIRHLSHKWADSVSLVIAKMLEKKSPQNSAESGGIN